MSSRHVHWYALTVLLHCGCQAYLDSGPPAPGQTPGQPPMSAVDNACRGQAPHEPLHRLNRVEQANTVADVFDIEASEVLALPPESLVAGFELAESMSRSELNTWLNVAETLSARAVLREQNLSCTNSADPGGCASEIISRVGARLFRRPLTQVEHDDLSRVFVGEYEQTSQLASSIEAVFTAMMVSPQFLFHESARGAADGAEVELSGYALASRLSYTIWAGPPDQVLLDAAGRGELTTTAEVRAQAQRMTSDPRFERGLMDFFRQYLHLDGLSSIEREDPSFSAQLREDYRDSIDAYLRLTAYQQDSIESLMTSNVVFLNQRLAQVLGIPDVSGDELRPIEMPSSERVGLLTQPAFMALQSKVDRSDPIHRGLFVLQDLLCVEIGEPPPNVGQLPPIAAGLSIRDRFEQHRTNVVCASCHNMIDPLGFPFESYDLLGRFRATENGVAINTTGMVSAPDELAGPVDSATDLLSRVAQSRSIHTCMASKWLRYAMRREVNAQDDCYGGQLGELSQSDGGSFRALVVNVVSTRAFRRMTVN